MRRAAVLLVAGLAFLVRAPQDAHATVSCTFGLTSHVMDVIGTEADDKPGVIRSGNAIQGFGAKGQSTGCLSLGTTVDNVARIDLINMATGAQAAQIDESNGLFAPGYDPGGVIRLSPEIKFQVVGMTGVDVRLPSGGGSLVLGADGMNLNPSSRFIGDQDSDVISTAGFAGSKLTGGPGNDFISAAGGSGTGAATADPVTMDGAGGNDTQIGGEGFDLLRNSQGDDRLDGRGNLDTFDPGHTFGLTLDLRRTGAQDTGFGQDTVLGVESVFGTNGDDRITGTDGPEQVNGGDGSDVIEGLGGDDTLNGGPPGMFAGTDTVSYASAPGPVTVDLGQTAPQDTKGAGKDALANFANVVGTDRGDTLTGTDGPNRLDGGAAYLSDAIPGPLADKLTAKGGADVVRARNGRADTLDCGAGADAAVADEPGTDSLTACESFDDAPRARIEGPALTRDRTPTFAVTANEPVTGFACAFDRGPFASCARSLTLGPQRDGAHSFLVRGADAQGASLQGTVKAFAVDTVRPAITKLRRAPAAFAAARKRKPRPRSARFAFTLSEPAAVTFSFARLAAGRKVGKRCLAPTRARRKRKRCARVLSAGSVSFPGRGKVTRTFKGRVRRGGKVVRLKPGAYKLTARASDLAGNRATPRAIRFRVLPR